MNKKIMLFIALALTSVTAQASEKPTKPQTLFQTAVSTAAQATRDWMSNQISKSQAKVITDKAGIVPSSSAVTVATPSKWTAALGASFNTNTQERFTQITTQNCWKPKK